MADAQRNMHIVISVAGADEAKAKVEGVDKSLDHSATTTKKAAENTQWYEAQLKRLNATKQATTTAVDRYGASTAVAAAQTGSLTQRQAASSTASLTQALGFTTVAKAAMTVATAVAGAFSIGQVMAFGKAILSDADALVTLSDKTGIGVTGLQRFKAVAAESGNSLEEITGAVSMMQNRIASGDASAVGAIEMLGLSLTRLRALGPEEQFNVIAAAIAGIHDPAQRTATAIDIFGRSGAEILPTLLADIEGIGAATLTMSEDTVRALDRAGDEWARFVRDVKVTGAEIIGFFAEWNKQFDDAVKAEAARRMGLKDVGTNTYRPLPVGKALQALGLPSLRELDDLDKKIVAIQNRAGEAGARNAKKAQDEIDRATAATLRFRDSVESLTSSAVGARKGFGQIGQLMPALVGNTGDWQGQMALLGSRDLPLVVDKLQEMGQGVVVLEQLVEKTSTLGDTLGDVATSIPDTLLAAFTGGGGIDGAIKGIATQLGDAFADSLRDAIKANLESKGSGVTSQGLQAAGGLGALAGVGTVAYGGSAKAGIGAAGMAGASVAVGALTSGATLGAAVALGAATLGIGAAAVGAYVVVRKLLNDPEKKINPIREAFVQAAGGLGLLNVRAEEAGVTLTRMLNAKNPTEYQAAIDELNAAFGRQSDKVKAVDAAIGTLASAVQTAGGTMPASLQATVDQLSTMIGLTDDQRDALDRLSSAAEPDFQALTKLAGDYGITLAALGPEFQQAHIDDEAAKITKAFDDLTGAGANAGGVLGGLADEVSTLVQEAIDYGVALPDSLQPIVAAMFDAGQLVDENGDKLRDLSGIKFKDTPLDKSTSAIVDALEAIKDLLERLPGLARAAADGVPANPYADWVPPDRHDPGGNPETYHRGGMILPFVQRAHMGLAIDEVPIIAQTGEGVLSRGGMRRIGGPAGLNALNAGAGAAGSVIVNTTVYVDGDVNSAAVRQRLARVVNEETRKAIDKRGRVA